MTSLSPRSLTAWISETVNLSIGLPPGTKKPFQPAAGRAQEAISPSYVLSRSLPIRADLVSPFFSPADCPSEKDQSQRQYIKRSERVNQCRSLVKDSPLRMPVSVLRSVNQRYSAGR